MRTGGLTHEPAAHLSPLATFYPGYFALVMATGAISLAAFHLAMPGLARTLFALNISAYVILWLLTIARLLAYPWKLFDDLTHHARAVTFLTTVAATCILGNQFAILTPWKDVSVALWFLGAVLWFALIYTFFLVVTLREPKPSLEASINGAWLLMVVSAESVCVLGTLIAPYLQATHAVLFIALAAYLVGALLYLVLICLIMYRWMFFSMEASQVTPPYWINMGALAITTLAGSRLLESAARWKLLQDVSPVLEGCTLFFWANGTWWIPILVALGFWRHLIERVPLIYTPLYWSFVFPLGMYTLATDVFAHVAGLDFLNWIPPIMLIAALVAWAVTFLGMLRRILAAGRWYWDQAAARRTPARGSEETPATPSAHRS